MVNDKRLIHDGPNVKNFKEILYQLQEILEGHIKRDRKILQEII